MPGLGAIVESDSVYSAAEAALLFKVHLEPETSFRSLVETSKMSFKSVHPPVIY